MGDFLDYVFSILFQSDRDERGHTHYRDQGLLDRLGINRTLYWTLWVVGMVVCAWAAKHWSH